MTVASDELAAWLWAYVGSKLLSEAERIGMDQVVHALQTLYIEYVPQVLKERTCKKGR